MGLGDMFGSAMNALGGTDAIVSRISESGIDLSALAEMNPEDVTAMLEERGFDPAMLEGLGLSVEDVIAKAKEHIG